MTEREAFEAWWIAEMNNPAHPNLTTFEVWQAACAWQREADAKVCESLGATTNGIYERNQECADKIRSGA